MKIENMYPKSSDVVCDFCNADGDAYDIVGDNQEVMHTNIGGIKVGSYCICGICTEKHEYLKHNGELNMEKFMDEDGNEEDVSDVIVFDQSETFGDNVRAFRRKAYGTDEMQMQFISFDSPEEMEEYLRNGR